MAITLRTPGSWAAFTANDTAVTLPTHVAGDMLILRVAMKANSAATEVITVTTTGWTKIGQGNNGTTNASNGGGSVLVATFFKVAESASETNPVVNFSTGSAANPAAAVAMAYQKAADEMWISPKGDSGPDTTSNTAVSATIASLVRVYSGDVVDFFTGVADDTTMTVPTITQTGVTFNAVTESPATALTSTTAFDIAADGGYRTATAGTATAAAVVTGTLSTAETNTSWMTVLRVMTPPPTGQAQARIVRNGVTVFGQAQARIKGTAQGYGQANARIVGSNTIFEDQFNRVIGTGMGTGDSGHTWTLIGGADSSSVNGTSALIAGPISTSSIWDLDTAGLVEVTGYEIYAQIAINSTAGGTSRLFFGQENGVGGAQLGFQFITTPTATTITEILNGTGTGVTLVNIASATTGTIWHMKIQVLPTSADAGSRTYTYRAALWLDGNAEPGYSNFITPTSFQTPTSISVVPFRLRATPTSSVTYSINSIKITFAAITQSGQAQAFILSSGPPTASGQAQALIGTKTAAIVVGNPPTPGGPDYIIKALLAQVGYVGYFVDDSDPADTTRDLVVISESVSGGTITNKYSNVTMGVVTFERAHVLAMDLASADALNNGDGNQTQVEPSAGANELVSNIGTFVDTFNSPQRVDYNPDAELAASALRLYSIAGDSSLMVSYAYNKGATMQNAHVAEARRAFSGIATESALASLLTGPTEGGELLRTIFRWAGATISNSSGQAQALIKRTSRSHGFAQARILETYTEWRDTFTRTVSDGFGTADTGDTYVVLSGDATDFDVDGSVGTLNLDTSSVRRLNLPATILPRNFGLSFQVSADSIPVTGSAAFNIGRSSNVSSANNEYRIAISLSDTGSITVALVVESSATATTGFAGYTPNDVFNVAVQFYRISDTRIFVRKKIWREGSTETAWSTNNLTPSATALSLFSPTAIWTNTGHATGVVWSIDNINSADIGMQFSGQAQATIVAGVGTTRAHGQAQAQIKQTYFGLGQAQAQIKQVYFGLGQAQGTIKTTYYALGQAQGTIKQAYFGLGQAQATIKNTYFGLGQAQATIKTVTSSHGQAQATLKVTYYGLGQAQARIKNIYSSCGQAQGTIKQVYSALGQAQAQIKTTYFALGQAQGTVKTTYYATGQANAYIRLIQFGSGQAQARIKNTYFGLGQSQAWIKNTYFGLGQAQARIKQVYNALGQAQAEIKQTYFALGQAQADIKQVYYANGQAQARIKNTYFGLGQANAYIYRIENGHGQAQARIKNTYFGLGQAAAWIENTYFGLGQAQGWIKNTYSSCGQAQGWIKAVTSSSGQAQAEIKQTYTVSGQAQADIKQTYYGLGQAQATIKTTYYGHGQAQGQIKTTYFGLGQAQAKLNAFGVSASGQAQANIRFDGNAVAGQAQAKIFAFDYPQHGQAQGAIKAVVSSTGQAQAQIKTTYSAFGQANAYIILIGRTGSGQAQAQIKNVYYGSGQANAYIYRIENGSGQAQARIKNVYSSSGQAQASIRDTYNSSGQAQATILAVGTGSGQSQAWIKAVTSSSGQAQADIKTTYSQHGQAQADIKQTYYQHGQAATWIKSTYFGSAQAQARINAFGISQSGQAQAYIAFSGSVGVGQAQGTIKAVSYAHSQSQALIKQTYGQHAQAQATLKVTYFGCGQSQAWIKNSYYGLGQAQAWIETTYNSHSQAQGQIRQTYFAYGQAQGRIKTTYFASGQAQALIGQRVSVCAQAQAWIKAITSSSGQAQGQIKTTYVVNGQAQGTIKTTYYNSGQTQAYIRIVHLDSGQAQASIKATYTQSAQAQARIKNTYNASGNAQSLIKVTVNSSGQAQATIANIYAASGQAQALITSGTAGFGQAAAIILQTYSGYGQANALIIKSAGYGQAQAVIRVVYFFGTLSMSDDNPIGLILSDDDITSVGSDVGIPTLNMSDDGLTLNLEDSCIKLLLSDINY